MKIDNATIVALVILAGVFILMSITILKAGAEAAIKMWGVMGALTGVAFGAITSYYFSTKANEGAISQMEGEKRHLERALEVATKNASAAQNLVAPFYAALKGENELATTLPAGVRCVSAIPEGDRQKLALRFEKTTDLLEGIRVVGPSLEVPAQ
jgi:hypothetical protein